MAITREILIQTRTITRWHVLSDMGTGMAGAIPGNEVAL